MNILLKLIFIFIIAIIITIIIVRLFFYIMLAIVSKIPILNGQPIKFEKKNPTYYKKEEDELLRDQKLEEKKLEQELESIIKQHPNAKNLINTKNKEILKNADRFSNVQSLIADKNKEIEHSINNKNNIYVKKNVGFWTNLVLGNKLSNIIDTAKSMNANNEGFWTNLVLANRRSRERGDISRGK